MERSCYIKWLASKKNLQINRKKTFWNNYFKKICILGFAFKANTNDTRESSAINICKDLLEEGAILHIHDPKVSSKQIEIDLSIKAKDIKYVSVKDSSIQEGCWFFSDNIYDASTDADAIVVLTEWEEYSTINWENISKLMRKPSWIFDSRSILNGEEIKKFGLNFWKIGNGSNNEINKFN